MADSNITITGRERCEQADKSDLQVRAVLDIASIHATDGFDKPREDTVDDFLDFLLDDSYKAHPSLQTLRDIAIKTDASGFVEELGYQLYHRNMLGLVVLFVTPVMTKTSKTSWSFSWGYTQSTYVYAESYDAAWRLGVEWADQCRADAKPAPKKRKPKPNQAAPHG